MERRYKKRNSVYLLLIEPWSESYLCSVIKPRARLIDFLGGGRTVSGILEMTSEFILTLLLGVLFI